MENINIASFSEANTATVKGIWQYDFGQILRIEGLGRMPWKSIFHCRKPEGKLNEELVLQRTV